MSKLLVIVGITGIQGGSVAKTFLQDPTYKIRGITRDVTQAPSKALATQGIEMVQGDINDASSLVSAFKGAHTIYGNTAFPPEFGMPPTEALLAKLKPGQTVREWCFETEVQQGKKLADAVARTAESGTLQLFIWSTLSHAKKWSAGKYKGVYHFDSKATIAEYIMETYPKVAARMSMLQMGMYVTNWKFGSGAVPWEKHPDGTMTLRLPSTYSIPCPLIVPSDAGAFAYALTKLPPGKNVLAFGDLMTWSDFVALWSKITGVKATFENMTVEEMDRAAPGGFGEEMGEMYAYADEFGYWGRGDGSVVFGKDLGFDIKATRIEEYIKNEDWSELLNRPAVA